MSLVHRKNDTRARIWENRKQFAQKIQVGVPGGHFEVGNLSDSCQRRPVGLFFVFLVQTFFDFDSSSSGVVLSMRKCHRKMLLRYKKNATRIKRTCVEVVISSELYVLKSCVPAEIS